MYSIVETLVDLARDAGVEFTFGSNVVRIDTDTNTALGVVLADGARLKADVVLANADLPYVYEQLLPPDGMARSLSRKRFSCSAISFFWGVDRPYVALPAHTLFLADDYRANFESIVRDHGLPANPGVYVHAPARLEAAAAPSGQDTLTAIVPVGHLRSDDAQDWNELRERAREHVFRRLQTLGFGDVREHIKFEESCTPLTWAARHNLAKGATHGLSHTLTQMGYLRPRNRHHRYHNLYFAGASTHPGTGVPTAMSSGRLAARRIVAELR
jgi:phytoene desaturase